MLVSLTAALLLAAPPSIEKLPARGRSDADFVPAGWEIESVAEGDLTGDGLADHVLVLAHGPAVVDAYSSVRERALVVLARSEDGLRLIGHTASLVDTETTVGAEVTKGGLVVSAAEGEVEDTYRFRFDRASGRMVAIGHDMVGHGFSGGRTSENYLTGRGEKIFFRDATEGAKPTRYRFPRRTPTMEEYDGRLREGTK